jgi:excisionase family DNA binding protein
MNQAMSRQEAAAALGVSTKTLDRWIRRPEVPLRAVKLGDRLVRVSRADVEALVRFEDRRPRRRPRRLRRVSTPTRQEVARAAVPLGGRAPAT